MTLKLVLSSVSEIDQFQDKLRVIRVMYPNFKKSKVSSLSQNVILKRIHDEMKDAEFSPKIINGTTISRVDIFPRKFRIHFHSELFSDTGFDVAIGREKGTRRHRIEPRTKLALRWVQQGIVRFSRGHEVDGLPALLIIARTIDSFEGDLQDEFDRDTEAWMQGILGGVGNARR